MCLIVKKRKVRICYEMILYTLDFIFFNLRIHKIYMKRLTGQAGVYIS